MLPHVLQNFYGRAHVELDRWRWENVGVGSEPQRCAFTLEVLPLPDPPLALLIREPSTASTSNPNPNPNSLPSSTAAPAWPFRERRTPIELSSTRRVDVVLEQGDGAHMRVLALDPDRDEPAVDVRLFLPPLHGRVSLDELEQLDAEHVESFGAAELLPPLSWAQQANTTSPSTSKSESESTSTGNSNSSSVRLLDPAGFRWSGVDLHYEAKSAQFHGTDLFALMFDENSALEQHSSPLLLVRLFVLENPCRPNGRCVGELSIESISFLLLLYNISIL